MVARRKYEKEQLDTGSEDRGSNRCNKRREESFTCALADQIVKLMDVDFTAGYLMHCKQAATARQLLFFGIGASIKMLPVMASPASDDPVEGLCDDLSIV